MVHRKVADLAEFGAAGCAHSRCHRGGVPRAASNADPRELGTRPAPQLVPPLLSERHASHPVPEKARVPRGLLNARQRVAFKMRDRRVPIHGHQQIGLREQTPEHVSDPISAAEGQTPRIGRPTPTAVAPSASALTM
jgi:hypothetical protein